MAVHETHLICVIHIFPCKFSFLIAVCVRIIFHETFHIERNDFPLSVCEKGRRKGPNWRLTVR